MTMFNPMLSKRRSTVEIVYDVLRSLSNGGVNKTSIMYFSSLNHDQLQRYLSRLAARNLIEIDDSGIYRLTPQGEETFDKVKSVISMLTDLGKEMEPAEDRT